MNTPKATDPLPAAPAPAAAPASGRCRAVIDIGTNSVKLLVGVLTAGRQVEPLFERGVQTRLGQGFFATRRLQADAIQRTAEAVRDFVEVAETFSPERLRLIATAAAREAVNAADLLEAVRQATGRVVEIISGDTEAELAFAGVASEPRLARGSLLVTDVGGGSTEFILGHDRRRMFGRSYPMGAVRVFEALRPPENPTASDQARCREWVTNFLRQHVRDTYLAQRQSLPDPAVRLVGVGGTVAILARIAHGLPDFDRARIEATTLAAPEVSRLADRLWSLPAAERKKVVGLPPERADIILTGVTIYEGILHVLDLPELRPSTRGLRFAALLDAP